MSEQQLNKQLNSETALQERQKRAEAFSQTSLNEALTGLSRLGGFNFLESAIEGIQNLNPERKARKKMFLVEEQSAQERKDLAKKIDLWLDLISNNTSIADMVEKSQQQANETADLLAKNQLAAVETVRELEKSYRSVQAFYKNTESDKITNITIVNASPEQITDLDNSVFIDYIADEINKNYDRLDLRENYSLLVLPGYLGSNKVLEKWAKIAYANKVLLFTDFADLERPDDVVDLFSSSNLTGGDIYRSNVVMSCNWNIGRGAYQEIGEEEDLRVPPSTALAGRVYAQPIAQVVAGKKYGGINEVDAVSFPLKKSEISQLEAMGLVPMVNEYGKVMAFSGKTLFNGDDLGLQSYSVVRVFDHLAKVNIDFLNRRAFENWNSKIAQDLRGQLVRYFDSIKGPGRLIQDYKIIRLEQDPNQKDRVYLDMHITPFFHTKSFIIRLDGTKGDDGTSWDTAYDEQ